MQDPLFVGYLRLTFVILHWKVFAITIVYCVSCFLGNFSTFSKSQYFETKLKRADPEMKHCKQTDEIGVTEQSWL